MVAAHALALTLKKEEEKNFSLAHPIFILACLCPFCVRFYSFDSIFFLPAHTRNIIPRVVSRGATHTLGRIQKKNSGQKEEEKWDERKTK